MKREGGKLECSVEFGRVWNICQVEKISIQFLNKNIYTIFAVQVVQDYPYVALDTEFPGVVARPIGEFKSTADYQYQLLRWVIKY